MKTNENIDLGKKMIGFFIAQVKKNHRTADMNRIILRARDFIDGDDEQNSHS